MNPSFVRLTFSCSLRLLRCRYIQSAVNKMPLYAYITNLCFARSFSNRKWVLQCFIVSFSVKKNPANKTCHVASNVLKFLNKSKNLKCETGHWQAVTCEAYQQYLKYLFFNPGIVMVRPWTAIMDNSEWWSYILSNTKILSNQTKITNRMSTWVLCIGSRSVPETRAFTTSLCCYLGTVWKYL